MPPSLWIWLSHKLRLMTTLLLPMILLNNRTPWLVILLWLRSRCVMVWLCTSPVMSMRSKSSSIMLQGNLRPHHTHTQRVSQTLPERRCRVRGARTRAM